MKNIISEYKLLGYYLIKLYDTISVDNIKYEQAKSLTNSVFKRLSATTSFEISPIAEKRQVIDSMIKKNVFKTNNVNGKQSFTQVYNYEICKNILAVYSCDGNLTFKLPKEVKSTNTIMLDAFRKMYTNGISLQLQTALNSEIKTFIQKINLKNRSYA